MKPRVGTLVRWGVLAALIAGAVVLLRDRRDVWNALATVGLGWAAYLVLLKLVVAFVGGAKLDFALRIFGYRLDVSEWFGLSAITTFIGYLGPAKAGSLVRIGYLKVKHRFDVVSQLGQVAGVGFLDVLAGAAIGSVGFLVAPAVGEGRETLTFLLVALLATGILGLGAMYLSRHVPDFFPRGRIRRALTRLEEASRLFFAGDREVYGLCGIVVGSFLLRAYALLVCVQAVGVDASFASLLMVMGLVNVSILLPLTPGNLGVTEGAIVGLLVLLGAEASSATAVALLSRAASMLVQVPLGIFFSIRLFGGLEEAFRASRGNGPEIAEGSP